MPMAADSRGSHKLAWNKELTRELFARYKDKGDMAARDQLIVNHLNLVRFLAAKFANRGEPLDDLVQVGTIGLIKAIDRFEPERGLEFTTYATPTILGEIKRHFRDKGWSVRVPRRLQELSAKVNQANEALIQRNQRTPSVEEIANYLDVSVDEVLEAMESSEAYASVPLDSPGSGDDDAPSIIDRFGAVDTDLASLDDKMVLSGALAKLEPNERALVEMRFVEGLTQSQIAERMGMSQVQVSRLLHKTLERMRKDIDPSA